MATNDLGYIPDESDDFTAEDLGTPVSGDLSNCSGTAVALTAGKTQAINDVVVAATAPTAGDVLISSGSTAASWVDPLTTIVGDVVIGGNLTVNDLNASKLNVTNSASASAFVSTGTTTPNRLPNLSTVTRDGVGSTAGQIIYNSTTNALNVYNGSAWEVVTATPV